MDKEAIAAATKQLELLDIILTRQFLETDDNRYVLSELVCENTAQQKHLHTSSAIVHYEQDGQTITTLVADVYLGMRLLDADMVSSEDDNEAQQQAVIATIEAAFRAEYAVAEIPADNEIEEFVNFNAVHNVWPFWREVVFRLARSARLPTIWVPLYKSGSAAGEETRSARNGFSAMESAESPTPGKGRKKVTSKGKRHKKAK